MIIVKLIVLICCFNGFSAIPTDFCEICLNHTLCKFKTYGPGPSCISYEHSALLTNINKFELLNNINERRNFVAMGHSKILPLAANMKKLYWSNELATAAQRWADQCDPFLYPDKEDECRDLENVKVGQNIASILGPSPGLSVKSFVEMWFMQVVDYTGSVTYYNKSQDYKTNHLTQLLWAHTEYVGCGKSKFYVDERNTMVERLVCNFAPKGNAHGRPVYAIGYPGTQCRNNMKRDGKYHGLCAHEKDFNRPMLMTQRLHPINSLLRILNLSNDSVKHEIDPIRNNLKQNLVNINSSNEHRNQKTRHILANKTNGSVNRMPQLRKQLFRNNLMNTSESNSEYHYQYGRGHSHIYHGHEALQHSHESTTVMNTIPNFRRYDYTTEPTNSYLSTDYRKFNQFGQCTRRIRLNQDNCASHQCRKAPDECCQTTIMCPSICTEISCSQFTEDLPCTVPYIPLSPELCPFTKQTCPTPATTNCNYHTNCPCSTPCSTTTRSHCLTSICLGIRKQNDEFDGIRKPGPYQYYDLIPNVVVRSGNHKMPLEVLSAKTKTYDVDNHKKISNDKGSDLQLSLTNVPRYNLQGDDYIYHSFDSGLRKRRQLHPLKRLRYTTLPNNVRTKKNMKPAKLKKTTEPITVSFTNNAVYKPANTSTEKNLSFDELMHLRKINQEFDHTDFRRQGNAKDNVDESEIVFETDTTGTTITWSPTFERLKYCTRKLTCTWTANTVTADDGKNKKVIETGSRTPPGYVEGCTRTSTCTREFWQRNKNEKTSTDNPNNPYTNPMGPGPNGPDDGDGDYCERRSLNVHRRNSDTLTPTPYIFRYFPYTNVPIVHLKKNIKSYSVGTDKNILEKHECECNNNYARRKREEPQNLGGFEEKIQENVFIV